MGSVTSHWSTLKQNGIFIAILSSFLQVNYYKFMLYIYRYLNLTKHTDSSNFYDANFWGIVYFGFWVAKRLLFSKWEFLDVVKNGLKHGLISIILFTIFMLYHRNSPRKHPMMTKTEIFKVRNENKYILNYTSINLHIR